MIYTISKLFTAFYGVDAFHELPQEVMESIRAMIDEKKKNTPVNMNVKTVDNFHLFC